MTDWSKLKSTFAMDASLSSISYRSSAYNLSSAGQQAKQEGMSKSKLIQECKAKGLDKEQIEIVLGGYS